ncbi:MAG: hypothetical protein E6337_07320 [Ligilactobacillus salivarius]|nr:hypothetical protein [Ligilactobacillus salivarius]
MTEIKKIGGAAPIKNGTEYQNKVFSDITCFRYRVNKTLYTY